jgi:hypothetical protein
MSMGPVATRNWPVPSRVAEAMVLSQHHCFDCLEDFSHARNTVVNPTHLSPASFTNLGSNLLAELSSRDPRRSGLVRNFETRWAKLGYHTGLVEAGLGSTAI